MRCDVRGIIVSLNDSITPIQIREENNLNKFLNFLKTPSQIHYATSTKPKVFICYFYDFMF